MCICDNPGIGRCYPLSTELKGDKVPAVAPPRRATKGLKFIQHESLVADAPLDESPGIVSSLLDYPVS
jgi:hypothetical protein